MSDRLSSLLHRLRVLQPALADRFGVARIGVFGSFARGEDRADSDLDLLIDFSETPTLFDLARLDATLEAELGVRVDTVPRDSLNPRYAPHILPELVPV